MPRLSAARVAHAATVIDPVFLGSPQFVADALAARLGLRLVVKVETLNPIRSFKGRGAEYFVQTLERPGPLACASAGNFGQALAWAARRRGLPLTVFAATRANPLKLERMRALGADVRLAGDDFDAAKEAGRAWADAHGVPFIEDGREPAISEGAGTIALELDRLDLPLDAVLVPLGNGALVNGIGTWLRAHRPATRVVAVSAAGAPAMARSFAEGRIVTLPAIDTIADGIGVRVPIPEAVDDMRDVVDEVVLVDDAAILAAMRLAHETLDLVLEPAGAAGLAAATAHGARWRDRTVATVLCGGNVAAADLPRFFGRLDA